MSAIVGKKTLFLLNINDPESPIELAFQVVKFNFFKALLPLHLIAAELLWQHCFISMVSYEQET